MLVASLKKVGALDGRGADTAVCKKTRRQKPTMIDSNTNSYRLGRRPGEQGPRPLSCNQGRAKKLATGKLSTTNIDKLKLTKDTITIETWNVQTLWAAGRLKLLRNEMKRFRCDIIGISEVRWTEKGETRNRDFIWSGEDSMHMIGMRLLLSTKA